MSRFLLFVTLLGLLSSGCQPPAAPPDLPTRVAIVNTLSPPPTPPLATRSPTAFPTPTPTATPTATLAVTPTPTATPTATPCGVPGQIMNGEFPSLTAGSMAYRVYLPPCYGVNGRSYPTLTLLPGNIHTDAIWDELGIDEAAERLINARQIPPLIIVMPDGGWIADNSSGGPGSYETVIVNDLRPFIAQSYCVWDVPAGQAIGGLSRGGYWALEIAFRFPDQYVSVGGHSAALLDQFAGPAVNPQQTGLSNQLGDLRIYLDFGTEDWLITNTRRLHEGMLANEQPHEWVLNPGNHDNAYWQSQLEAYLTWYTAVWSFDPADYPSCDK